MQLGNLIEEIFNFYQIKLKGTTGKSKLFVCPFHEGHGVNHNAVIFLDNGFWKCLNPYCGAKGYIPTLVSKMEKCSQKEAKNKILKTFNFDIDDIIFLDDEDLNFKYKYYPLPKSYKATSPDNAYLKLHKFSWDTFSKLEIGIDTNVKEKFILPYTFDGTVVGYCEKHWNGRIKYPPNFPVNNFLYGFDLAKVWNSVYVVEGQRDVWRLIEHKLPVVGLNTSVCSNQQLKLLLSNWNNVILCGDGDSAGIVGMINTYKRLKGLCNVSCKLLPYKKDPENIYDKSEFLSYQVVKDLGVLEKRKETICERQKKERQKKEKQTK